MFFRCVSLWDGAELAVGAEQVDEGDGEPGGDGAEHEVPVDVILELVIDPPGWSQRHGVSAVPDLGLEDSLGVQDPSQGAKHAHFCQICSLI